jgi:putative hydrolase of the HAD superfamily
MRQNGVDVSWDEYYQSILTCVRERPTTAPIDAARYWVTDDNLWEKVFHEGRGVYDAIRHPRPFGVLLNDITAVVADLKRDFKLGVIANQHPPVVQGLHDYGIGAFFDVIAIDEIVGFSKPDPAIFQWALNQAGCAASEALMVGDRPDNDIAPAKALGMVTVRFRRGLLYSHYDPRTPMEFADAEVRETAHLAATVRRVAASPAG